MKVLRNISELRRALQRLDERIKRDDLAALIVHLNDTYLVEERPPSLPGLARVARLTKWLRRYLQERTGRDRLLVLHSGDMLSPSYISNTLKVKGAHMIAALNECGVDFATLGNHEFDFGLETLACRSAEAEFPFVFSNFSPPEGRPLTVDHALWPPDQPFLAILAFGGGDVRKKAEASGFGCEVLAESLRRHVDRMAADERIRGLVVLSHMDRKEDHELVELIRRSWPRPCCAYILGGHDHDMAWFEYGKNVVFSKNLANCRTLTLVPVSKAALMVPHVLKQRYLSREREIEVALYESSTRVDIRELHAAPDPGALIRETEHRADIARSAHWPTTSQAIRGALRVFLRSTPRTAPRDFTRAYARLMHESALRMDPLTLRREANNGTSAATLNMDAELEAREGWNRSMVLGADGSLLSIREDPAARTLVCRWLDERDRASGPDRAKVVKAFGVQSSPTELCLDATEAALRSGSTAEPCVRCSSAGRRRSSRGSATSWRGCCRRSGVMRHWSLPGPATV